jgi:formylglycine-generating enzyme required for sulfatase activity
MKNNSNILSEKVLDELLGHAFLNMDFSQSKNQKIMETVANYSLGAVGTGMITKGKYTITKVLLVLTGLGVITTPFFFLSKNNNQHKNNTSVIIPAEQKKTDSVEAVKEELIVKENQKAGKPFIDREKPLQETDTIVPQEEAELLVSEEATTYTTVLPQETKKADKTSYVFPSLTEKEIKANENSKNKMAKAAFKLKKEKYYLIPGMNFYMQTAEVTNLEYRTFLFDLLIKGKKDEFLKAKPEQNLWINCNGTNKFDSNKDYYFSDKRFNEYPVVNISVEGAEMYCLWLKELLSEKMPNCEVKLPTETEWMYAARAGKANATYPWGRDSIQNKNNRFLANCCMQKLKEKFNQPISYPSPMKINLNAFTTAGMATGFDTLATVLVYAYNPNDYYLYCMSGNVSEMVYVDGSKAVKTKGGNWASDFEHLKIGSEDEFRGGTKPSPMIGFRPIIILNTVK